MSETYFVRTYLGLPDEDSEENIYGKHSFLLLYAYAQSLVQESGSVRQADLNLRIAQNKAHRFCKTIKRVQSNSSSCQSIYRTTSNFINVIQIVSNILREKELTHHRLPSPKKCLEFIAADCTFASENNV